MDRRLLGASDMSRLFACGSILLLVACGFDRDRTDNPDVDAGAGADGADPPGCQPGGRYADPIFPEDAVRVRTDILYREVTDVYGTHRLTMDVYLPPEADTRTARPAIVWLHGGNFKTGTPAEMAGYGVEFARRGWVAASIEYRLLHALDPDATQCEEQGPGGACSVDECAAMAQEDAEAALGFLREHAPSYGVDPARIVIGGFSAGSITAFTVGYEYDTNLGRLAPSVIAVAALDGVGSKVDDFVPGDPPFILIRSDGSPGGGGGHDGGGGNAEFLAAVDALGYPIHASVKIPDTVHTDLVAPAYVPLIAGHIAPFLHQHALACATN